MTEGSRRRRIRVLVVDDSVFMGMQIARILNEDEEIEVIGRARDGLEALTRIVELEPDVLTLDVEMPGMDGITALKHIMVKHPVPIVMISALTDEGAQTTFDALRLGAIDIVPKPSRAADQSLESQKKLIISRVKRASSMAVGRYNRTTASRPARAQGGGQTPDHTTRFIGVGAGAGGYYSLLRVIPALRPDFGDVLIVAIDDSSSHVESFSSYLADHSSIPIVHAWDASKLEKGACYICSCDDGVILNRDANGIVGLDLHDEAVSYGKEGGIDRIFRSLARVAGNMAIGIVMSGAGNDGAEGLCDIRRASGIAIVQNAASAVDPSMPRAALKTGAVVKILPDFLVAGFLSRPDLANGYAPASGGVERGGAASAAGNEAFSGWVEGVDIIEYLQFVLLTGKQTLIEVIPSDGARTRIYVRNGSVIHASSPGRQGEHVLYECLCARSGTFGNLPWHEPSAITIHKPGEFVLMEAARKRDENEHPALVGTV